jgi:hypothetical protein
MMVSIQLASETPVGQGTIFKTLVGAAARRSTFLVGTTIVVRAAIGTITAKGISPAEWRSFRVDIAHASEKLVIWSILRTEWNGEGALPIERHITGVSTTAVVDVKAAAFRVTEIVRARILVVTGGGGAHGTDCTGILQAWIRSVIESADGIAAGALWKQTQMRYA